MRRLGALGLAVVGQAALASLDPGVALLPAFAAFLGSAALVLAR
jgi:hypothetical protein